MKFGVTRIKGHGRLIRGGISPESRRNPGEVWGAKPQAVVIRRAGNEREPRDKPGLPPEVVSAK